MTLPQALRRENYMKPIRGTEELAFSEQSLIVHIKQIFKEFEEDRPSKRRVRTNMVTPDAGLPTFRSYMDVKEWFMTNTVDQHGKPLTFTHDGEEIKISLKGKPYYSRRDGTPDLSFEENQVFLKLLFNYKYLLEAAITGSV